MWQPEERIKYKPLAGRWPTVQEAAASRLYSPLTVANLKLNQRTWVPAMVPWRATEAGEVTPEVIEWYARFAKGKPGAIVVEATGVRDIPSGPLLRIGHDRYLEGLSKIVEAVHHASEGQTRLFIQLIDFLTVRRRVAKEAYIKRFLPNLDQYRAALGLDENANNDSIVHQLCALDTEDLAHILSARDYSDMMRGYRDRVTDVDNPAIANLPQTLPALFADAALRAEQAGFDGVELHYAHAYTMASFLSRTNTRDDRYGGNRENRIRLPLETFHAVRNKVSSTYTVGCRFLSEECVEGGNELSDAIYFGKAFARAGMDFLSLSRGGKFDDAKQPKVGNAIYPYTGRSGYECMPGYVSDEQGPYGRNAEPVNQIRAAIRNIGLNTPVVLAGGFHQFEQAESALRADQADIIGFARQAMADPDWFEKVRLGCGDEVRLCEYTNYCEGLDQKHKQVTCNLWDRLKLDQAGLKSKDGRRRLTAPEWTPVSTKALKL